MATLQELEDMVNQDKMVSNGSRSQSGQPIQKENYFSAIGKSALGGYVGGFHGIAQPLLEAEFMPESVRRTSQNLAKNRQEFMRPSQEQYPITSGLSQGIAGAAPTMVASAYAPLKAVGLLGKLGIGAAEGGISGAHQYINPGESRGQNTIMGSALGLGASGVGQAGGAALNKLGDITAPYVQALKFSKLGQMVEQMKPGIFSKVKGNEEKLYQVEKEAWKKSEDMASTAREMKERLQKAEQGLMDEAFVGEGAEADLEKDLLLNVFNRGQFEEDELLEAASSGIQSVSFDKKPFLAALNRKEKEILQQNKDYPMPPSEFHEKLEALERYKSFSLNDIQDVMKAKKAINDEYRKTNQYGKSIDIEMVNAAESAIYEAMDANFAKNPMPAFEKEWARAKTLTTERKQVFDTIVGDKGKKGPSNYLNFKTSGETGKNPLKSVNPGAQPDKIYKQYTPKEAADGTEKMDQFISMTGDPDYAASVFRNDAFKNALDGDKLDVDAFFPVYKKFSDEQKIRMFSPEQKAIIDESVKRYEQNPKAFGSKNKEAKSAIESILGSKYTLATAGATAGGAIGGVPGAVIGASVATGIPKAFQKYAPNINAGINNPLAQRLGQGAMNYSSAAAGAYGGQSQEDNFMRKVLGRQQ